MDEPEYWRDRAAYLRALADSVSNENTKAAILKIAVEYEHLAKRAEERALKRRRDP
jgi:hypothetical protein